MALFGWKYPKLVLVADLEPREKLRVVFDEKRQQMVARALQELQKLVSSAWKA